MASNSKIEWTDATWNPIKAFNLASGGEKTSGRGHYCEKVSPGCANCYAERMQPRFGNDIRYNAADRDKVELFLDDDTLTQPLRWKRPRMIFVCSMTDLFGSWVTDEWLDQMFAVMALTPQHTYQILTKRPERMLEYFDRLSSAHTQDGNMKLSPLSVVIAEYLKVFSYKTAEEGRKIMNAMGCSWPLPNVWLGVSVEDQKTADERIPTLLQIPAAVRFLSVEPMLGAVDVMGVTAPTGKGEVYASWLLDWVIVGGESGPNARPMHPDWARSIRDQCVAAGVPFFFKQWGNWMPLEPMADEFPTCGVVPDFQIREKQIHDWDDYRYSVNIGKHKAGRLLDGRTWDEMPETSEQRTVNSE